MTDRKLGIATENGSPKADRWNRGVWLFRDATLERFATFLDEAVRVPGTRVRIGVDGFIGLIPGFGDAVAGLLSLIFPIAAWTRGVPYVTIVRMAVNIGIGVLVGTIPLFGDIFDIAWKTNRRNYQLLRLHLGEQRRNTRRDWAFLAAIAAALTVVFTLSIVFVVWAVIWLINH